MKILPIGEVLSTDLKGYLVNSSIIEDITPPWLEVVTEIKDAYLQHFGHKIHSMYVRGSVARGTAIKSFSDIDTLTVLSFPLEETDYFWVDAMRDKWGKKYPFVTAIANDFILCNKLLPYEGDMDGVSFHYAFTIQTQCVPIFGQDLTLLLPRFKPDKKSALYLLIDLNTVFDKTKKALVSTQNKGYIREWCRWVMKIILRNAFLLVMDKENIFTRDLYPCCSLFSKYFPEQEPHMKIALEYAINPISDVTRIINFLDNFGLWLRDKIEEEFGDFNI